MSIWVIADLHLAIGVPSKDMAVFGAAWDRYMDQLETHWKELVRPEDLVLLPGDISWAMRLEEVLPDLAWIDRLPGTKVLIRGNHDYWWSSARKMASFFPPSIHFLHNTAYHWKDVAIGGTRLWDTPEYHFHSLIEVQERGGDPPLRSYQPSDSHIFEKELQRLERSLAQMDPSAKLKIVMTHYPPISADLAPSSTSVILERFGVDICVFGHLHSLKSGQSIFGKARGVEYVCASSDFLRFCPRKLR